MFKSLKLSMYALVVVAVLASCASAPKKTSEDASLVVIPTSMINETGQIFARNFYLQFSTGQKEVMIRQYKTDHLLVVLNQPGVKIVGIRSVVDVSKNFTGPDGFQKLDIELPYAPGKLVVSDEEFALKMTKIDSRRYSSDVTHNKVEESKSQQVLNQYLLNKDYASWF